MLEFAAPDTLRITQASADLRDPHIWSDNRDRLNIRYATYESLVRYDDHGRYGPALAESWRVDEDARMWTFGLRSDVFFHSGERVDAQAVVASLDRARGVGLAGELGTGGLYRSYLGAATVQAADAYTVRVVTPEPMADLLDLLVEIPIVSGIDLAGTGPYRLVEAGADGILVEEHTGYWGKRPAFKRIRWQAEPHEQRRTEALLSGEADLVTDVSPAGAMLIERGTRFRVLSRDSKVCVILMCNAATGICRDRRVRWALNHALDLPEIISIVKDGAARPLNGPLTPLHFGHDPATPPYSYEPHRARRLLAEAGHGEGLHLVLDIPAILPDEAPHLAQVIAKQYARVGITTQVKVFTDRPAYAEMVKAKQIDDICCFDSSPLSTWRVLREKFHSGVRGAWWQGYSNLEVDVLLDRAQATVDEKQRQALYRRAYRLIRDDAPWVFLYSPTLTWGMGAKAAGTVPGIDGVIRFV